MKIFILHTSTESDTETLKELLIRRYEQMQSISDRTKEVKEHQKTIELLLKQMNVQIPIYIEGEAPIEVVST